MKLLFKILFFVLAIFQTNICEANVLVFNLVVSEVTSSNAFNFGKSNAELEIVFLENDFANTCKSERDLIDYRNWAISFEVVATKGGAKTVEGIYEFTAASGKTYVGQSGNIAARLEQHIASGKLFPGTSVRTTEVLGGKAAREIAEQLRINSLGGIKYLENIRNPIGPARQYLLTKIP
jgi:hypothetical protein